LVRETSATVDLRGGTRVVPHVFGGIDVAVWRRVSLGVELKLGARPRMQLQAGEIAF
jgi:hypothetical protein